MGKYDARYAVGESRPNAESQVEQALQRIGYEPLVVRYNKWIKCSRIGPDGRHIRSRTGSVHARPFIPGYFFLPLDDGDDATLVDGADGVRRLFRNRDSDGYLATPKLIRARVVEQILEAARQADETPAKARADLQKRLEAGEEIKFRLPLGMIGTLTELDDAGRARYFTEWLGAERRGTLEATAELDLVEA